MKLLACSDFQLGSGAEYGTPERPRLRDQQEALEQIIEAAVDCDLALFLGDAFHTRRPGIDELLVFNWWAYSMPCSVLMLAGNHDLRGPGQPSSLELFGDTTDENGDPNVFVRPGVTTRSLPGERPVALAFLPWAHPGPLRAARGPIDPLEHADGLLAVAAGLRAQVEREAPGAYSILCTHHALSGMSLPTGLSTGALVGEPVLDLGALSIQGWDAILAGHIHKPELLTFTDRVVAVSVGSPYVCDFGEAHLEHGAWYLHTEAAANERPLEYVELPGRPFVTLEWEGLEGYDAWRGSTSYDGRVRGAVVRLRWRLSEEEAQMVDTAAVRRALYAHGAHKVYAVQLDVQRATRARAAGLAEDTEPLEGLDAWLAATECPPGEAERLRDLTRGYLAEEAA